MKRIGKRRSIIGDDLDVDYLRGETNHIANIVIIGLVLFSIIIVVLK